MSLQSIYESFLSTSKADSLAQDAVLSYVTTLTTFSDAGPVLKHLEMQRRLLRKKTEKTLNAIADRHALFLEVETVLEFVSGGGAYLPGLDDNFLVDQVVVLPIQHVVHFNSEGKIKQIRLYWDQASLLKSLDVIGSRARAWPIKDGKDQIRLITSSAGAGESQTTSATTSRRQSSARPTKDPHGTLEPFAANIPEENEGSAAFDGPVVKPRASARPAQRDLDELFVNEDEKQERGASPSKASVIAPKIGAGKNFGENRLYGEAQSKRNEIEDRFISPHPTKFNHFEFHDGHNEDAPEPSMPKPKTKHQSQWDFSDFTTPAKRVQRLGDQRTFALEDYSPEQSPVRRPHVPHARRDADTHFQIQDEGEAERPRTPGRGQQTSQFNNKALFSNNVISEQGAADENKRGRPLSIMSNVKDRQKDFGNHWDMTDKPSHGDDGKLGAITNVKDRHKDFDPHFKMTDSPGQKTEDKKQPGENQSKAIRMMQANWESSDPSPQGKENRVMGIAGDGMGRKKGVERGWGIGDDDQPTEQARVSRKKNVNARSTLWDE